MKAYELLYFVAPTTEDDVRAAVQTRIETVVKDAKGQIDNVEDWGRRKLAYEVNGLTDADYILVDFHTSQSWIAFCASPTLWRVT
jgi:small subunit ribosomal protein S6